jgi:hypothetical protein
MNNAHVEYLFNLQESPNIKGNKSNQIQGIGGTYNTPMLDNIMWCVENPVPNSNDNPSIRKT